MKEIYLAPEVEVIEVEVEKGFAGSFGGGGAETPDTEEEFPW